MRRTRGYSIAKARRYLAFLECIKRELLVHPMMLSNPFTSWFKEGKFSEIHLRAFVVQFSVFSNLFLFAQLAKMINAESEESMRDSRVILANEIGVRFEMQTGVIEGNPFFHRQAHFEWLLKVAYALGLKFGDVGKYKHGTWHTHFFCNELRRLYGSEEYTTSLAASYAIENWANAGFWGELIEGLTKYNAPLAKEIPLHFFVFHDKLEKYHAHHTQEELEHSYFTCPIDEAKFITTGKEMLDAVDMFWGGLHTMCCVVLKEK